MKRILLFFALTLSGLAWWHGAPVNGARAFQGGYPLNPNNFTSLGPSPFGAGPGLYTINTSKALAAPVLTKPDNSTISGVFFTYTGGEIAVFTFDSITIPSDVTVQGVNTLNTRPIALLSIGSITVAGTVNVSGNDTSRKNGAEAGPGGGGGGGGGNGVGGVGTVNGIPGASGGDLASGGSGGDVFPGGGGRPGVWVGDIQTGSGYNAGGGGFGGKGATGSVQTGNGLGGVAYGDLTTRLQGGGGGGGAYYLNEANTGGGGGGGGGAVEIGAIGDVSITGNIYANGGWSYTFLGDPFRAGVNAGGGGAGGGIIIHGANVDFSGAQAISAHGGGGGDFNLARSGGGGGRVHVIGASISEGCVDVNGAFTNLGPAPMPGVYTFSGTRLFHLQFGQQPTSTRPNTAFSPAVTVRVVDGCGNLITSSTAAVTLAPGNNPGGATLGGMLTVNAVGGVATFNNVTLNRPGNGYTLVASGNGLTSATSRAFNIINMLPTITAVAVNRTAGTTVTGVAIAGVNDAESGAGGVTVSASSANPNGVTLSNISNNGSGVITATVTTTCNAGNAVFTLTATDGVGGTSTAQLNVTVMANTPPTLAAYPAVTNLNPGAGTTLMPNLPPTDNGFINNLTATAPGFTGSLAVNAATGVVTISNAAPAGSFTVTVTARDNCNATATTTFTLNVNAPPQITGTTLSRQQGNPATSAQIATVSDAEQAANTLSVTATLASGSGVTLSGISINTSGNVTANVAASCTAATSTFTLRVTDSGSLSATATLTVNVTNLAIAPVSLPNATLGQAYNEAFSVPGGAGPYSFSLSGGTLPTGLGVTGGALTGTPLQSGTFMFTVTATRAGACTLTRNYTLFVDRTVLAFYPLAKPVRLLDTRTGQTSCLPNVGAINGGTARTLAAAAQTCDGLTIPANAAALAGHITTVNPVASGFLTMWPSDAAQPLAASNNYLKDEIRNNAFTVALSKTDGSFKVLASQTTDVVVDVTGYYAPPVSGGLFYHPLPTPVRLLDTRAGQTACFTPGAVIAANGTLTQTGRGTCGIPAEATALVGNTTTVGPASSGYLTMYPGDVTTRPLMASSNYTANEIVNGPFTVGLGAANGDFKIFSSQQTDLVVDIVGYYSPLAAADANNIPGLLLTPLNKPIRLLDTRTGFTAYSTPGAPITAGTNGIRTQPARVNYLGEILPAETYAIIGNATTVSPAGAGYLTFWPSGGTQPGAPLISTSNYITSQIINRHFNVCLGVTDGAFRIFSSQTTDLVVDVSAYFAPQP